MKPWSQACENNKQAILEILEREFAGLDEVLEIGSGTGQHACHFSAGLPDLVWQASDREQNLDGIRAWLEELAGDNAPPPLELDVSSSVWPCEIPDGLFTANTLHIMAWEQVEQLFAHLGRTAPNSCTLVVYGPFNYGGIYTSPSNERFDQWLFEQNRDSAIRNFEAVDELASGAGFALAQDYEMPANNRTLVWRR